MVQEGKRAKVVSWKKAEVKKPISGKFRVPIEEVASGEMANVCKVKQAEVTFPSRLHVREGEGAFICVKDGDERAREVVPAYVEDGDRRAREVVPAYVEDGDRRAREVVRAHVEDGDRRAREAVPAYVEDGDRRAREAVPAYVEDGDKRARKVVPAHVEDKAVRAKEATSAYAEDGESSARKMDIEGRTIRTLPEPIDGKSSRVQQKHTQAACNDLTLSQLFAMKAGADAGR